MDQNLESLIEEHAKTMAGKMIEAADRARSEEDVRHDVNKLIDEFIEKAGLDVRGRHEYGLAGGRIDSKYGGVVIEYKDPRGSGKIIENKDAPGVKAVVKQIEGRFRDLQAVEHVGMERILGVGCDGDTFVFVRARGNKLVVEDPQPVTQHNVGRLLRALVSLGASGRSFTPENLAEAFGSDNKSARDGVRLIHDLIHRTDSPKAKTFFHQWQILFGEVCGYDIHGQNARIRKLAEHYDVRNPSPSELLFAVHTYYAIFIKLLAAEVVSSFAPLGISPLKKLISAPTSAALRDEMRIVEQGGIWAQIGIHNFLEGDIFAWYLDAWDDGCASAVRTMTETLDAFDPSTLSVDPTESRDLLKQLYHQLFPKSVRHDLGEYYTPDWLAELTLDKLGYDGNPDRRLLDPACGSGTFLVAALNRVKSWYDEHRYECGFGEDELLHKILSNIIGFDLNPLAVMTARTNYLMALRDLLRHGGNIEIPVYLCDSIMTPSEYSDLFRGGVGATRELKTSAGLFHIPVEVTESRDQIGRYADVIEFCIRNRYTPGEFVERCRAENVLVSNEEVHKDLYEQLQKLDEAKKNGVWARIIKNAFAPLFIRKVDYVAGNPPWVNWESLPEGYRDGMKELWRDKGLFTLTGAQGRLGGGKKDLSMLFVYIAVDSYLDVGGRLGFVITQSVFKTKGAGDGFRRLHYSKDGEVFYLKPLHVEDLSAMQVFEGAANRTAVFVCEKSDEEFSYPIDYTVWRGPSRIGQNVSLDEVRDLVTESPLGALPVDSNRPNSPWLTAPGSALTGIQKVIGPSDYKAYEGVNTGGLNGCFWVRILEKLPNGELLIENLHDVGKIKVDCVQTVVEPDLVYPLLRGRDVKRWNAEPSASIILAQDPVIKKGIPERELKLKLPKTFEYLRKFEGDSNKPMRGTLRGRALFRQYYKPSDPFYSMYNVGTYTVSDWKIVWREQSSLFQAALVTPLDHKAVVPDHKLMMVSCSDRKEANYLLAMLNSSPSQLTVHSYVISTSTSTHVLENISIPRYDEKDSLHTQLSELSQRCHEAAAAGDGKTLAGLEAEIDLVAARVWGISKVELKAIQDSLAEMSPGKTRNGTGNSTP